MNDDNLNENVEKDDVIWLNDIKKSREIVQEILRFGVNQTQIINVIGLLALELEDRDMMINIRNIIEPKESDTTDNNHVELLYPGGNENE